MLHAAPDTTLPVDCVTDALPPTSAHDASDGLTPLCYVISGDDGAFQFRLLPNGRYAVVPYYVGENIRFDVLPPTKAFDVDHAHHLIEEVFRVEGFTVQGNLWLLLTIAKANMFIEMLTLSGISRLEKNSSLYSLKTISNHRCRAADRFGRPRG